MPGGSRSLPGRPNLRHLKLEAKRRLAAGEFPTLHDAQPAIAREHGLTELGRPQAAQVTARHRAGRAPPWIQLRWLRVPVRRGGRAGLDGAR